MIQEPISFFVSRLPGITRVAVTRDSRLERLLLWQDDEPLQSGAIWMGRVTRVTPGIKAAFLDLGDLNVFLNDLPGGLDRKGGFESALKEGSLIAVQVRRPAQGEKLAQVSANLKLVGFSGILMPFDPGVHFSNGFSGDSSPETFRKLLNDDSLGWIVRSGSEKIPWEQITREADTLKDCWFSIKAQINEGKPRMLLQGDPLLDLIQLFWKEGIRSLFFDDEELYKRYSEILHRQMPMLTSTLKLHLDEIPLFDLYKISSEITSAFNNRVRLKSGGWLDIRHTEGMIAIDVNSGKSTSGKAAHSGGLKTNLEAAAEIARQVRIRNLAGLIVIDFINGRDKGWSAKVDKALAQAFKSDHAKTIVLPVNRLGIGQVSRERTGTELHNLIGKKCGLCRGTGFVDRPLAAVMALQEQLLRELPGMQGEGFSIHCGSNLAGYLISKKELLFGSLEKVYNVSISIVRDNSRNATDFEIQLKS